MLAVNEWDTKPMSLDGVLNIRKPLEWTSHDVVAKLRRVLKGIRIGHAGTLDPAATGVLPILVGKGTRIAEYLLGWDKEYEAVLRLGQTTDTLDATGTVQAECAVDHLTPVTIHRACAKFQGEIEQVPPMYSAVKIGGVPLYKSARAGKVLEREARRVTVYELEILRIEGRDIYLRVRCSKGTYIRSLCADIGAELVVGGHLLSLERRRVGPLTIEESYSLAEAIDFLRTGYGVPRVLSLDHALAHMPSLIVNDRAAERARHGVSVPFHAILWDQSSVGFLTGDRQSVRLKDVHQQLVGIGAIQGTRTNEDNSVAIVKVFEDAQATSQLTREE